MFLFVGSVAYGQDLIKVDVKVDTDKLVELLEKKDKEIDHLQWIITKKIGEEKTSLDQMEVLINAD